MRSKNLRIQLRRQITRYDLTLQWSSLPGFAITAPLARFHLLGCQLARVHALNRAVNRSGSQLQRGFRAAGLIPSGPGDSFEA
jgi:hypothetical protein